MTQAAQDNARKKALALYRGIEEDFLASLKAQGLVFAEEDREKAESNRLMGMLEEAGARIRNGRASVVLGDLSRGCVACTGACPSRTFAITNNCHRDCYFCFNPNQRDFAYYCEHDFPWRRQLEELAGEPEAADSIALSGGEPLLNPKEVLAFFKRARELFPNAHLRMYTSGDLLSERLLEDLRGAGMDEIRFSIKLEDSDVLRERVLGFMETATRLIPTVMVEMPVIPDTEEEMKALLLRFDKIGIFGVNLLEFTYPMWNWEAFDSRGFKLKNPPFEVVYDYTYAGSLAVAGSEELALSLMLWSHEKGLHPSLHYCSLENKHRGQIRKANEPFAHANPNYAFDYDDFFLKTVVAFGHDRPLIRQALARVGSRTFTNDDASESLSFHPRFANSVLHCLREEGRDVQLYLSCNVVEKHGDENVFRELSLRNFESGHIQLSDLTSKSDRRAGCSLVL